MAAAGTGDKNGRLAVIAGSGLLPFYVARAATEAGENPLIIALKNESDADWEGFDIVWMSIGDLKGIEALFKARGIKRIILSGAVGRRPEWKEIRLSLMFLSLFPFVLKTLTSGGDNAVLEMVIGLIEAMGCKVIGAHEVAPDLLADIGSMGKVKPDREALADIKAAVDAALALGRLDIGQGAVAVGGRIVALEGAEGTDAMLERVRDLRLAGRISRRRKGVLVKLAKPQQDERADLPAIGLSTLAKAAQAGLAGIVGEAGRSLVLDRDKLVAQADKQEMFIYGVAPSAMTLKDEK